MVFSHSSAYALVDHPRNVPDDVLATMGAGGGVCMVAFVPRFVSAEHRAWALAAEKPARAAGIDPKVLADFSRSSPSSSAPTHLPPRRWRTSSSTSNVRDVAGIDHVGLGGDFDGVTTLPSGLEDVSAYPALLEALAARGWSVEDLGKLTCRNVLSVLRAVEDVATA